MTKPQPTRIRADILVPVVRDGMLATKGAMAGRLVPIVAVDLDLRPDLAEVIRQHRFTRDGDVIHQWAERQKPARSIVLLLQFKRPSETVAGLVFRLPLYAGLVDAILRSECLYLQGGKANVPLVASEDRGGVRIDIGSSDFSTPWERIYRQVTTSEFRGKGLSAPKARTAAQNHIQRWRDLQDLRMSGSANG